MDRRVSDIRNIKPLLVIRESDAERHKLAIGDIKVPRHSTIASSGGVTSNLSNHFPSTGDLNLPILDGQIACIHKVSIAVQAVCGIIATCLSPREQHDALNVRIIDRVVDVDIIVGRDDKLLVPKAEFRGL